MMAADSGQLKPSLCDTLRPEVTEALLRDITRRIVEAFHPEQVILFGSYAYGTPHRDSDVDLLVVKDTAQPLVERIRSIAEVAEIPFLPMDILVHTPAELQQRLELGDYFLTDIVHKGRMLYSDGTYR